MSAVIQLTDIHKTYQTGEVAVHAVRGVDLTVAASEIGRAHV